MSFVYEFTITKKGSTIPFRTYCLQWKTPSGYGTGEYTGDLTYVSKRIEQVIAESIEKTPTVPQPHRAILNTGLKEDGNAKHAVQPRRVGELSERELEQLISLIERRKRNGFPIFQYPVSPHADDY